MVFRCKELGINSISREAIDFCPTASATGTFDTREESTVELDFELLRAQMREALSRVGS